MKSTAITAKLIGVLLVYAAGAGDACPEGNGGRSASDPGVAALTVAAEGSELLVAFVGPATTLLGFDHQPGTGAQREAFRLARENLKTGDGLIRFNTSAGCRLTGAEVDMGVDRADRRPGDQGELSASYRFVCDRIGQLRSAAVGLFVGFPALQRVFVRYDLPDAEGAAELTANLPVVSFVPLQ